MTYVQENVKKLQELKKLTYEELCNMYEKIMNNPNAARADIINICVAYAEKEIELGKGLYTQEEIEKELLCSERYNIFTKS